MAAPSSVAENTANTAGAQITLRSATLSAFSKPFPIPPFSFQNTHYSPRNQGRPDKAAARVRSLPFWGGFWRFIGIEISEGGDWPEVAGGDEI